ncbi:hypothetical protein PGQ11_011736 [Apiospora arundinis]|uniref:Uncharacterized protein n=1 Tax=Apiospora arundinis TaxID=335852 RepID=A0ABR2I0I4_9PEZI
MATMNDVNVRLLMHMLRMYTPNLAGTNWDQISAEMGQSKANLKKKFGIMKKEFLEHHAAKNNGTGTVATPSSGTKRGRPRKSVNSGEGDDADDDADGTPTKKQRRSGPVKKEDASAIKFEDHSDHEVPDEA